MCSLLFIKFLINKELNKRGLKNMKNQLFRMKYFFLVLIIFSIFLLFSLANFFLRTCSDNNDSVGKLRINIKTYLAGKDQTTHPSVISFENKWNGYFHWMAYTPYPFGNGEEENPSIAVSNDLLKWETPKGMENPIAFNEETGCNELKDVNILYREDINQIEVWYLGRVSSQIGGDNSSLMLLRKTTKDGIHWSKYEIMSKTKYLSPTIIWDDNKYKMWGIGFDTYNTEGTFVFQESDDGKKWTTPTKCYLGNKCKDLSIWHGSVTPMKNGYGFVFIESMSESQTIEYCESIDGIHFDNQRSIVKNSMNSPWKYFYRPSLVLINNNYYLYYGVVSEANEWYISMSHGEDIDSLYGVVYSDAEKMLPIESEVTNTKSFSYKVKQIIKYMRDYLRFELFFLILLGYILCFFDKVKSKLSYFFGYTIICLIYTYLRVRPEQLIPIIAMVLISIVEGFVIYCIVEMINKNIKNI